MTVLRRVLRRELNVEVLGLRLTVKRILLLAVLACILVLAGLMVSDLVDEREGPPYNLTERNETTGRYEEGNSSPGLCVVFIFLALVLMYFIVVEIRS